MFRAVVLGHGDFAAGLVSAVRQICGRIECFIPLSNSDLAAADLEQLLRDEIERSGAGVVFTDLPAGSAAIAARRVLRDHPELAIVHGANLATLLDFALNQRATAADTARASAAKGQSSINVIAPTE